ncbi:NAD(+)--rifampin ADP-ribosyltransferase [Brevibacterium atlanticum]|uniref:NAD(+)--rifampin ADP-ribosyltransferase n=1 Tax=Brevibacterium atlanticum TaxID=2697563 RepID=UPI0014235D76|nr:NAD(+)--rifampin ADP-ribosyltransferase [Brevibacterium atlanticum]
MTEALDEGPFFHGTRAALEPGQLLTAGYVSNYRPEVTMNHIYFTSIVDGAGLAAEVAALGPDADSPRGEPHVYEVEPLGEFVDDPNVTDKKFPGNPTRSYRSAEPLRIIREVEDWKRLSPQDLQMWRERLAAIREDDDKQILN